MELKPSDPDFPFDLESYQIQIKLSKDYPNTEPATFTVLSQDIPPSIRTYLLSLKITNLDEWHK